MPPPSKISKIAKCSLSVAFCIFYWFSTHARLKNSKNVHSAHFLPFFQAIAQKAFPLWRAEASFCRGNQGFPYNPLPFSGIFRKIFAEVGKCLSRGIFQARFARPLCKNPCKICRPRLKGGFAPFKNPQKASAATVLDLFAEKKRRFFIKIGGKFAPLTIRAIFYEKRFQNWRSRGF